METLGPYKIVREIGRGGCGAVYLAQDPRIGRNVAIKTIQPGGTTELSDDLRQRFRREAMAAGSLSHPHIVTIYEFDDAAEMAYIAMEYIDGQTLADKMAGGQPLALEFVLQAVHAAAEALDFAHARNIVHRDVKPANFLITNSGFLKVADFGIAKLLNDDTGLTNTGMMVGTVHYISPEQVASKPVTGRSDQFSLAVIAYEMLCGRKPFEGDSWASVLHQILSLDPPPVREFRDDIGGHVTSALSKALAKDPENRHTTCAQFARELRGDLTSTTSVPTMILPFANAPLQTAGNPGSKALPTTTVVVRQARSAMRGVALGAAAIVLLGGAVLYRIWPDKPQTGSVVAPMSEAVTPPGKPAETPAPNVSPATAPTTAAVPTPPPNPVQKGDAAAPKQIKQIQPALSVDTTPPPDSPLVIVETRQAPPPPVVVPPPAPVAAPTPAPVVAAPVDPRAAENAAWENVRNSSDVGAIERFRAAYPNSPLRADADRRIEQLDWERTARAGDAKSYRDYLAKHPAGANAEHARAELAKFDRLALLAANRKLVDAALERYRQAFESKNADALRNVWPSMKASDLASFQNFFRIARTIRLELRSTAEPEITADSATVQCRRILAATDERGGALPTQDQMITIHLRKNGDQMLVESLQVGR